MGIFCISSDQNTARSFVISSWIYCICFTLTSIVTWVLRDYADQWFLAHSAAFGYCRDSAYSQLCSGKEVAVRFSFANFSFFCLHFILLFWCKHEEDPRIGLHTSLWFWKILAWAGTIVGFFFVPSSAIVIYAQVARFGAGLFLIFVMIEMVSWFYDINEWLIQKDTRAAWAALISGAVLCFLGGLALIGVAYYYYAPSASCSLNVFFITWSIVIGFATVGLLFIPDRLEVAGLMTSGSIFLYASYLLISALSSEPENSCVKATGVGEKWIQVSK